MFIDLNPDTIGLGEADFTQLLSLAPACGFQGVDFPVGTVHSPEEARALGRQVADAGMQWGLVPLPCDFLRIDDDGFGRGMAELEAAAPLVEAAACDRAYGHVWPGSDERQFEENFAWHVDRLRRLGSLLGSAGVRLGIEFLGPKTLQDSFRHPFIRSLPEAVGLIDAADCGLGVVVDSFHWYTSGATLGELSEALAGRHIVNVHANDATAGRTRDQQLDDQRSMPLETGLVDAPGVLRVLDQLGYDGPVIAEPLNPHQARFAQMPPKEVLEEVGACMQKLFCVAGVDSQQSK